MFHPNQSTPAHKSAVPVDQLTARAIAAQAAAAQAAGTSEHTMAGGADEKQTTTGGRSIFAILGVSGAATLLVGLVLAVACTLWALQLEVPYQVAFLAGYITFAASVCISAALVAIRNWGPGTEPKAEPKPEAAAEPQPEPKSDAQTESEAEPNAEAKAEPEAENKAEPETETTTEATTEATAKPEVEPESEEETEAESEDEAEAEAESEPKAERRRKRKNEPKPAPVSIKLEPDYAAWQRVDKLRVADAARLWCGIEPGYRATPEVMERARAILDAIEGGELAKVEVTGTLAQYRIGWHTEVPRDALQAWATSKGHAPRFLCDE
jgi:chemotaxis protein histidine kinase CheA